MLDPDAMPKDFPADTCGRTRPVGFQFIPATGFWPTYRFMTPFMEHHKDLSKVRHAAHVCLALLVLEDLAQQMLRLVQTRASGLLFLRVKFPTRSTIPHMLCTAMTIAKMTVA